MFNKFSAFVIVMLCGIHAYGQQKWTLKACVEYAMNNNIAVQQSALVNEAARVTMIQNKAAMLPSINANVNHSLNFGRSVDPYTNQFTDNQISATQLSLSGNVILFDGLRLLNTVKQSKLDYEAGKNDLAKVINDISLSVASSYLQVLFAKEQLKAADLRLESINSQRITVKKQVDAGVVAEGTLMDIEAQVAQEELLRINAVNTVQQSLLTLTQLMNLDSTESFDIEVPQLELADQSIVGFTPQQIYENAILAMPEVKAAEIRLRSAQTQLSLARGGYMPQLSAFGSVGSVYSSAAQRLKGTPVFKGFEPNGYITSSFDTVYQPVFDITTERTPFNSQLNQNLNKSVGLSLQIPIFNALNTKSNISRAKIGVQRNNLELDNTKLNIFKTIQQAHADAKAAQLKYEASKKAYNASKLAATYSEKKFNAGMGTSLEFLNAKNNATRTESEMLQAKFDLIFRIKVLEFYNGQKLTL